MQLCPVCNQQIFIDKTYKNLYYCKEELDHMYRVYCLDFNYPEEYFLETTINKNKYFVETYFKSNLTVITVNDKHDNSYKLEVICSNDIIHTINRLNKLKFFS